MAGIGQQADPVVGAQSERGAFGQMIRDARRAADLSQSAFARAANISPVFLSQIETGKRVPSDRVAKRLAEAAGLPWRRLGRILYQDGLRSSEASELFIDEENTDTPGQSVLEIPAVSVNKNLNLYKKSPL